MFRLSLENFKTWKSKTIYLQIQNGIVLISGESGKGKTSILQSIDFVITGKGKKIIRRGERSCMVYLNFRGIDITRTKGPNRLKVTVDDLTLEDADAQIEINKIFGVDFSMTSFIRQKSYKSLKGALCRAFTNASIGPSPKPLIAPNPYTRRVLDCATNR